MTNEDPYYVGPSCEDPKASRKCVGCHFCRLQEDGSLRCSTSGRKLTEESEACANYM